jgi:hypothetical protein
LWYFPILPSLLSFYAILEIVKFAFCTRIAGAGSAAVAGSDTFSTETFKQHPFGTVIMAVDVTLKKFSVVGGSVATSAGVTIALLVRIGSPSIASAIAIGPTVPPSGMAMLPLKLTA